ncbi:MAG: AAA family ATPase, partial [Acidimicrobiia bacterium]
MGSGLVARNNELRRARHLLNEKGVVVLAGLPGVGKTAICDVIASQWAEGGRRVFELRGTHGLKKVAFGAVTMGLRVTPATSESETLARVIESLIDGPGKALVVVDDVHNIDDASAGVVVGLAQSSEIALIMTLTSGESIPVDITSVWARWPDCRLDIGPLDESGVAELLATLLPDLVTDELTAEVAEVSLGYPLYVVTIAEELRSASAGQRPPGVVVEPGSDRLTSLMERRLARLDREERRLFDVVAFAEATSLQIIAGREDLELVERLRAKGLVRVADGRIQVAHPLLGSVARETLTSDGQRSCAGHLLGNLNDGCDAADVASVVRKALATGLQPDPRHVAVATEMALSWGDYRGAARLASTAPEEPELRV